jgi:hypothetical protein
LLYNIIDAIYCFHNSVFLTLKKSPDGLYTNCNYL